MASPFPGMDPYLERFWRDVHARLIIYAADQLQENLPSDLRAWRRNCRCRGGSRDDRAEVHRFAAVPGG